MSLLYAQNVYSEQREGTYLELAINEVYQYLPPPLALRTLRGDGADHMSASFEGGAKCHSGFSTIYFVHRRINL